MAANLPSRGCRNLNPSHLPFLSHSDNRRTGQAIHNSVSQPKHYSYLNEYSPVPGTSSTPRPRAGPNSGSDSDSDSDSNDSDADADVEAVLSGQASQPSWRGAFKRRMEARAAAQAARKVEERKQAKIPVPALPDLRFEQGVLLSIRPFVHRAGPKRVKPSKTENGEEIDEAEKDGAMVGGPLTAEGAEDGDDQEDIFAGPLRIEWAQLCYVIFRDQVSTLIRVAFRVVALGVLLLTACEMGCDRIRVRRCFIRSCRARHGARGR